MELKSRYGDIWKLEETSGGYTMEIPEHSRFGSFPDDEKKEEGDLYFIDPPGGPFIRVGGKIESDLIIRLKLENNRLKIYTYKEGE